MPPLLSLVIPSHRRPDLLRACLASVTRYAPSGTEIVVVDDGSAQGVVSSLAAAFPGVRRLRLARPRGFCVAANAGITATSGAIVELLNDDTEVTPGWAQPALACFQDPLVAAVAPLVLCWPSPTNEEVRVDSAGDRYYWGGIAGKRGHQQPLSPAYLRPRRVFGASASSAFFRRDVLLQVGGFPEFFEAYFEDVDLSFRLHWAGYHILYEPGSRVLHRVSASYGPPCRRLLERQSLNEERVFWRNVPRRALMHALPHHLAVLVGKAWRRWHEGGLAPFVCGRLRLLRELSALREHRRWLGQLGSGKDLDGWEVERCFWH